MGQGLPPICIRPAIRFIANTPLTTRAGVVSSVGVHAIPFKKTMTSYTPHVLGPAFGASDRSALIMDTTFRGVTNDAAVELGLERLHTRYPSAPDGIRADAP